MQIASAMSESSKKYHTPCSCFSRGLSFLCCEICCVGLLTFELFTTLATAAHPRYREGTSCSTIPAEQQQRVHQCLPEDHPWTGVEDEVGYPPPPHGIDWG